MIPLDSRERRTPTPSFATRSSSSPNLPSSSSPPLFQHRPADALCADDHREHRRDEHHVRDVRMKPRGRSQRPLHRARDVAQRRLDQLPRRAALPSRGEVHERDEEHLELVQ
eukprot:31316-Pelagococcus_subviridis.AAC.1